MSDYCYRCNGQLGELDNENTHSDPGACIRAQRDTITDREDDLESMRDDLATALRRAEEAEAIANQAMEMGLEAVLDKDILKEIIVDERDEARQRASEAESIANLAMSEGLRLLDDARAPRPRGAWREEDGPALWWAFPAWNPPCVGTPLDDGFPDYVTHWTPIVVPFGADGNGGSDA